MTEAAIEVEFVPSEGSSPDTDGYGPGGHPRLRGRDYSVAWEKPPLAPDPWLLL